MDIGEDRETVRAFVQKEGLTFPILLDEKKTVAQRYLIPGVPISFFVNREGVIQARHVGPVSEALIKDFLDQIQ